VLEREKVLVIDDEPNMGWLFREALGHRYEILNALDGRSGLEVIKDRPVDLVLLDLRLPDMDGLEVLREIRRLEPCLPVVIITAYATIKNAVEAIKAGAYDYVVKPFDWAEMEKTLRQALTVRSVKAAHRDGETAAAGGQAMVVRSRVMEEVLAMVRQVADTDANVLIQGESGTGKEVVARMLHGLSRRRDRPFLPINCAAVPENLLEAELFGYEQGAFTGASRAKPGKFELANGGTLFLDEIGDMPVVLQTKLLRVLEEKAVEHLGGTKRIGIDVRLVAATNRDLGEMVRHGLFREDLYYRLAVIPIYLPPLRERREEIIPMAEHFLEEFARRYDRGPVVLSESVKIALLNYPWPGNVRELRNLMERLAILCAGNVVTLADLPAPFTGAGEGFDQRAPCLKERVNVERERIEREMIVRALELHSGNRTRAARYLGVSRRWLQRKIQYYGLD